jgi:hypothetical protein
LIKDTAGGTKTAQLNKLTCKNYAYSRTEYFQAVSCVRQKAL